MTRKPTETRFAAQQLEKTQKQIQRWRKVAGLSLLVLLLAALLLIFSR